MTNCKEDRKHLKIEFMYLDLSLCGRCQGSEAVLEEAISEVIQVLKATGIEVDLRKIHIESMEQAEELGFVTSPTIRINDKDIQLDFKESICEDCGDLCGDEVDCRVWVYQGKEYTVPPKAMIIDAILSEVYGNKYSNSKINTQTNSSSSNLNKFFSAKVKKEAKTNQNKGCCCDCDCSSC